MLSPSICPRRCRNSVLLALSRKQQLLWVAVLISLMYTINGLFKSSYPSQSLVSNYAGAYWDTTRTTSLGLRDMPFDFREFYEDLDRRKDSITEYDFTEYFLKRIHRARAVKSQPFRFVQIGASRGFEWNDPITAVKNSSISYGLMVEPVLTNFKALSYLLREVRLTENIKPVMAAAGCASHREQDFHMVSKYYGAEFPHASEWNKHQVGSFNRDHVLAHLCFPGAVAEGTNFWRYANRVCDSMYTLRHSYCWNCDVDNILHECIENSECGAVTLTSSLVFGVFNVTSIRYGTMKCMTDKDVIHGAARGKGGSVTDTESIDAIDGAVDASTLKRQRSFLYIKRSEEQDSRCPAYKFIVSSPVDCLPGI
jgi:hypothetical protein